MRPLLTCLLLPLALLAETVPSMDSGRGRQLFESQNCIQCHRLNGQGGNRAPDLGRMIDRGFTPEMLAGTMWNHAPAMWSAFREEHIVLSVLTPQDSADLFAAFYSAHFFDMPSDAGRGKALFTSKACAQCHGMGSAVNPKARAATQWGATFDAIALVTAMSNHTSAMRDELFAKGIHWPALKGADIGDMLVYIRNLPESPRGRMPEFKVTAGQDGEKLFQSKGCASCHQLSGLRTGGMDLDDIAASFWNHGANPKMSPANFTEEEMSALLGYVWAAPFFESPGNAARGAKVFRQRRCVACHGVAGNNAPNLLAGSTRRNGITMVSALWRHGPAMLADMNRRNIRWPRFRTGEMADVIAYLNSGMAKAGAEK